ncbi:MAG: hypothetical protein IIZ96_00360, partial [Oscillospiraceae bacterium]|nr:hypothetical protein [Oscillospiraceae bacterium]
IKKLCDGLDMPIEDFFKSDLFKGLEQELKEYNMTCLQQCSDLLVYNQKSKTRNPNPLPTGFKFGFLQYGGP